MGSIDEIYDASAESYQEYLGRDIATDMEREYYSGLSSCDEDDNPEGAIVWRLAGVDLIEEAESEIVFFDATDKETARDLLDEYGQKAEENEVKRSFFELSEISEELIEILKESGFTIEKREGQDIYATLSEAAANRALMPKKAPRYVVPLSDLDDLQFRQGITNCVFSGVTGLNEDIALLAKEWYEEDASCAYVLGDKATGLFLVHALSDGTLMPVLLFAAGIDARKNMLELIRYSVLAAARKYEGSTRILIRRHDEKTRKLSAYLFPGRTGEMVLSGERTENM
ncbi:MAG: hypothetical protein K6E91_00720 [Butyrivibrio sp.]|nr:hypothetical protein [Butyrivibrio sp.]